MTSGKGKALGVVVALVLAFGAAASAQVQGVTLTINQDAPPSAVDLSQLWRAWNLLDQNFVQVHASTTSPTDQKKIYGLIKGLTDSYGDPYTVFFPPADATVFNQDVNGSFGGVGMELGMKNSQVVVIAPLKDSPAKKAGIMSGDIVFGVGTTSIDGLSVDDAVKLIRGPVGTSVGLTLGRGGQQLKISVVREVINIPVIDTAARGDGIFVISLYSFSQTSPNLFRSALRQYLESGDTKLLLDLRGNPGGYLDAAVDMASYFLPVGDTVVTEDFRGRQQNITHRSYGYDIFKNQKLSMAILTDQGTASAAEILAGALSQHGVAKLVGARSFGKGSVQQLLDLGGGAELKVTVARWLTPNGTSISDGGLSPDIKVDRTAADAAAGKDPQLDAAVAWLAGQ